MTIIGKTGDQEVIFSNYENAEQLLADLRKAHILIDENSKELFTRPKDLPTEHHEDPKKEMDMLLDRLNEISKGIGGK